MSESKDDFAERLQRIREAREGSAASQTTAPTAARAPSSPLAPRGRSSVPLLAGLGVVVAGAVMLAVVNPSALRFPPLNADTVVASTTDGGTAAAGAGFLGQFLASVTGTASASARMPVEYLPPAPEGWIRITPQDVQDPDLLATLQSQWSAGLPDRTSVPLDQHPGFSEVIRMIETFADPDMETKILARKRTKAVYLNPNGEVLFVGLGFQDKVNALGPRDNPASWTDELVRRLEKDLGADEMIERIQLAGMEVTNRTHPTGQSLVARPIGKDIYAPNGLRLVVALTDRTIIEIKGMSAPKTAETLIASIDREALLAQLD